MPSQNTSLRTTLACQRCRKRKSRCDFQLPRCGTCARANVECTTTQRSHGGQPAAPRHFVASLEDKLARLQAQVQSLPMQLSHLVSPLSGNTMQLEEHDLAGSPPQETAMAVDDLGLPATAPANEWLAFNLFRITHLALAESSANQDIELMGLECPISLSPAQFQAYAQSYQTHIYSILPFVALSDLQRIQTRDKSDKQDRVDDPIDAMILAIGAMLPGPQSLLRAHEVTALAARARAHSAQVLGGHTLRSLQLLLLLTVFSLFDPMGGNTWHLAGLALDTAIAIGLHREKNVGREAGHDAVYRKAFWSCYLLDRCVALSTGSLFGISDEDITTELITDVNCTSTFTNLCALSRIASQLRDKDGSARSPESRQVLDTLKNITNSRMQLASTTEYGLIFAHHLSTWCLGPPFASTDQASIRPVLQHGQQYAVLVAECAQRGVRLPWVTGYSLLHSTSLSSFACSVVQLLPELSQDRPHNEDRVARHIVHNLASNFPALSSLSQVTCETSGSHLQEMDKRLIIQGLSNPMTKRLLLALLAMQSSD
ncbi:hypothetical protein GQ53DRAFT_151451 [Thozetella sp. PMI_491]|nr:hypothetical protein GQ53DRAFT_151451 [Thozetella sp. PMI_491]